VEKRQTVNAGMSSSGLSAPRTSRRAKSRANLVDLTGSLPAGSRRTAVSRGVDGDQTVRRSWMARGEGKMLAELRSGPRAVKQPGGAGAQEPLAGQLATGRRNGPRDGRGLADRGRAQWVGGLTPGKTATTWVWGGSGCGGFWQPAACGGPSLPSDRGNVSRPGVGAWGLSPGETTLARQGPRLGVAGGRGECGTAGRCRAAGDPELGRTRRRTRSS